MSLNIRGIEEEPKVAWVRRLKNKHQISFLRVQETQLVDSDNIDVVGCWGDPDHGCDMANATGRSGGLLNI